MVGMTNQNAPYSGIAGLMAAKGRYGDTELLHVRPDELAGLASVGQLTINPDTGLPEAFSFKSLLPAVGAIAGSVLLPGIGTAIGSSLLTGVTGAAIGSGLGSFAGGLAAGQSPTQALIGGLVSGATSGLMGSLMGPSAGDLAAIGADGATAATSGAPSAITEGAPIAFGANAEQLANLGYTASDIAAFSQAATQAPGATASVLPAAQEAVKAAAPLQQAVQVPQFAGQAGQAGQQLVNVPKELAAESGTLISNPFAAGPVPAQRVVTDFGPRAIAPVQEALQKTGQAPLGGMDVTKALLQRPSTYTPLAFGAVEGLMAPPEFDPNADEGLAALESTYTPRDLRVTGGEFTQGDLSQEDYTRLALEGGLQSPLTPFRYEEEDTVTLAEGGTPEAKEVDTQVEEDTVASEEKRKEEEILQKRKAASEVDKFISNAVGGAALGAMIQGGLNQDPAAIATPYGQGAQPINTGANFGFNQGGLVGLSNGGSTSTGSKKNSTDSVNIPISLQAMMKRLGVEDPTPFLEFAQKTKQIESSGGVNRINPNSSARGDFQWLTKVNPKAKKGVHGSVKTAVNRTILSYKKAGQKIPEWLKTLDNNSTKSTKDLEKNVLSLTPNKELDLFFGNMNYATGSDKYLNKIAKGDKGAMYGAYSDIHHTRGREDTPTKRLSIKTFYSDMPEQIQRAEGGQIQSYFEGKVIGPGDGQSDQVLFDVEGNNPDMALLSPDEYVIPADAVAMIGSGSSNAGAKKLDGFVKNIRKEATGKTKQQKPIKQGLESFLA